MNNMQSGRFATTTSTFIDSGSLTFPGTISPTGTLTVDPYYVTSTNSFVGYNTVSSFLPTIEIMGSNKGDYLISILVPGVPVENMKVYVKDGTLQMAIHGLPINFERPFSKFLNNLANNSSIHLFALKEDIDLRSIRAYLKDGILKIKLKVID